MKYRSLLLLEWKQIIVIAFYYKLLESNIFETISYYYYLLEYIVSILRCLSVLIKFIYFIVYISGPIFFISPVLYVTVCLLSELFSVILKTKRYF